MITAVLNFKRGFPWDVRKAIIEFQTGGYWERQILGHYPRYF